MTRRASSITRFEPNTLANEIIGATLSKVQARETALITVFMQEVADMVVATFFARMSSFMGTETSMMSPLSFMSVNTKIQTGWARSDGSTRDRFKHMTRRVADVSKGVGIGGIQAVGGAAWTPLSQRYVQYKGTEKFWVFKNARNAVRDQLRRKSRRKRLGLVNWRRPGDRIFGTSLKEWIAKRNSLKILGETQVLPGTAGYFVQTSGSAAKDASAFRFEARDSDAAGTERRIRKRIPVVFKVFPNVQNLVTPENTLLKERKGAEQVTKLLGRQEWHRPLMRPLLAYYQQVLLRKAWDDTLIQMGLASSAASTSYRRPAVNVTAQRAAAQRAAAARRKANNK